MKDLRLLSNKQIIDLLDIFWPDSYTYFCKTSHSQILYNQGNPIINVLIAENGNKTVKYYASNTTVMYIYENDFKIVCENKPFSKYIKAYEYLKEINFL